MRINDATDDSLSEMVLNNVIELDVSGARKLSSAGLSPLLSSAVTDLDCSVCPMIDDGAVAVIAKMPALRKLTLDSCEFITDKAIASLTETNTLRDLSLRWCYNLSDRTCESIATMNLTELCLEGVECITDRGAHFLSRNRSLRKLVLPEHCKIGDDGLAAIANGSMPLESLTLAMLSEVSEIGIHSLSALADLRQLIVVRMDGSSDSALTSLISMIPELTITRVSWTSPDVVLRA